MTDQTRSLEVETEVDATPDEVWDALTTSAGLRRWFPLDAKVEPGADGSVWLSWGPGCEGQAPIHVWEPPSRFGWTESHGNDADGRPIRVAVDFHIQGRDGSTVVRLVQSGFSASADWDDMYDALKDGWTYFLFNLRHYFAHHAGRPRNLAWKRAPTALSRTDAWERLVESGLIGGDGDIGAPRDSDTSAADGSRAAISVTIDRERPARLVSMRAGHHFAVTLPDLDDSVFFVELEGAHVGFWLSTYRTEAPDVERLQDALEARIDSALGTR